MHSPLQLHNWNVGKWPKMLWILGMWEIRVNEIKAQNGAFWCILAQIVYQMFYLCFTNLP